jgi:hypothetical protein
MSRLIKHVLAAGTLLLCISSGAFANDFRDKHWNECSLDTLEGTYLFSTTGYSLIGGVWQPKAIVEFIQFNGDGTLSVPAATVANRAGDGAVAQSPPGTGIYTLGEDCKGTLQFTPGPSFDIFASPKGLQLTLIQTNPNNVLQGSVKRIRR